MIKRLSHLGHGTRNVDEVLGIYANLFNLRPSLDITLKEAGQRSAFIPIGNNYVEIWQPLEEGSPAAKTLAARGEGLSHLAFVIDDPDVAVESLQAKGARVWKAPGAPGVSTIFVHPRSTRGILIELITEEMIPALYKLGKP